jgi:hypothetical protein
MLTKVCFGIVTLGMMASLTSKIYIVYVRQQHRTWVFNVLINFGMVVLIGLAVTAQSIATKRENDQFYNYRIRDLLNSTGYMGY